MPTRRIFLSGLALDARIGILEHERRATQPLHIDAEFDIDITRNVDDQDIQSVLDYRHLREAIVDECTRAHVNLIETLSERVAHRLLRDFEEVRGSFESNSFVKAVLEHIETKSQLGDRVLAKLAGVSE